MRFDLHGHRAFAGMGTGLLLLVGACAAVVAAPPRYISFAEARPILADLAANLPTELNTLSEGQKEAAWPAWIERHDKDVRARLEQGDEDTIVNWLLFGTSFTSQPRAILGAVEGDDSAADRELVVRRTIELLTARLDDLVAALGAPASDERRLFARRVLEARGLRFGTAVERDAAREYLLGAVMRVAREQEQIDQDLAATSRKGDSIGEFVERSRLFRTRGLSLDTSLLPNYAIERSLAEMKTRGLIKAGDLERVAIVGPGLDFADKDVGFDFYPQQTVQPFAVIDSIRRLGLASTTDDLQIVLLDISPRVIDHVTRAAARAANGEPYLLHLALTRATDWTPEVRQFWSTFGDHIGAPAEAAAPQAVAELADLRAVRAAPEAVGRISVTDLNIVTQRLDGEAFDLMIATNVFVYYDAFEQALAMSNAEAMLKPGAFLLANFSAPPVGALTIRPVDTHTTLYASAGAQGENIFDFVVWYQARSN